MWNEVNQKLKAMVSCSTSDGETILSTQGTTRSPILERIPFCILSAIESKQWETFQQLFEVGNPAVFASPSESVIQAIQRIPFYAI